MCDNYENNYEPIAWCAYCKSPIYENEGYIRLSDGSYYHYNKENQLLNCYYPEGGEEGFLLFGV